MTRSPRFTLVADGPSDEMLIPALEWLLKQYCPNVGIEVRFADARRRGESKGLAAKIAFALKSFPCECLFVHRDAEGDPPDSRRDEVGRAIETLGSMRPATHICVVPVRMSEAWLLIEEQAIRRAAGNPNGTVALEMPRPHAIEKLVDPKGHLHSLLATASDLPKRRRRAFERDICLQVARSIDDFSGLRQLAAFQVLENNVQAVVRARGWDATST